MKKTEGNFFQNQNKIVDETQRNLILYYVLFVFSLQFRKNKCKINFIIRERAKKKTAKLNIVVAGLNNLFEQIHPENQFEGCSGVYMAK